MDSFLIITIAIVLLSMGMVLLRGVVGPSVYDRIQAANSFGTCTVIVIAFLSYVMGDESYLDIALIYALVNFIATIALLRYFRNKAFSGK